MCLVGSQLGISSVERPFLTSLSDTHCLRISFLKSVYLSLPGMVLLSYQCVHERLSVFSLMKHKLYDSFPPCISTALHDQWMGLNKYLNEGAGKQKLHIVEEGKFRKLERTLCFFGVRKTWAPVFALHFSRGS